MTNEQCRTSSKRAIIASTIPAIALLASNAAAAASNPGAIDGWSIVISLVVFAATAGSALLNVAAIREWDRNWGIVSGLPLFGLLVWGLVIVVAKQLDPDTHQLWLLEIFAWAMINMIYMVTAMTAKRMFAKRDGEETANS